MFMGSIWLMIWIYATVTSNRFVERWIYEVETTVTFLNQMDNFHLIIPHFSLKCALKSFFLRLGKILHSWKALDLKSKQERFPSYSNLHIQLIYSSDALTTKFKVMYTNFHNNTINWQFRCFFTIENQHYFSQIAPALALLKFSERVTAWAAVIRRSRQLTFRATICEGSLSSLDKSLEKESYSSFPFVCHSQKHAPYYFFKSIPFVLKFVCRKKPTSI